MFQRETLLNQFSIDYFAQLAADVTPEHFNLKPAGGGHSPLWILGHLAICGELGQMLLGGELQHQDWMATFGPGSSDDVANPENYSKDEFMTNIKSSYEKLTQMANSADEDTLNRPHGVELLDETKLNTVGDLIGHLLTTHFAFHTAQLSGWRRATGHTHLF